MRKRRHTPWILGLVALVAPALVVPAFAAHATITAEEVIAWQQDGEAFLFIDTRQAHLYEYKHARGAINVPAFASSTRNLPTDVPLVLYDAGTGTTECARAADALTAKGHDVYVLEGGMAAWEAQSRPIVAVPGTKGHPLVESVGADDLLRLIDGPENVVVFDVRDGASFSKGRIPGARPAPELTLLLEAVRGQQPTDLIVVYDDGGDRALQFAEKLRRQGYRAVKIVYGGMPAWKEKGLRVER